MNKFQRVQQALTGKIGEENAKKAVEVLQKLDAGNVIKLVAGPAIVTDEEIIAEMKKAKVDSKQATVADVDKARGIVRATKAMSKPEKPIDPKRASRIISEYGKK